MKAESYVQNKRNYSLDTMRLLLCFFIVSMHFNARFIPKEIAEPMLTLFFTAVPCFFMLSGFYMKEERIHIYKTIKRIFVMLILSSLLYSVFFIAAPNARFTSLLEFESLKNIILYNHNPFGIQLWYLSAYIYVLLFFLLFITFPKPLKQILIIASPVMIVIMSLLGKYGIGGGYFTIFELRNAYTTGIPYFLIGHAIGNLRNLASYNKQWRLGCVIFLAISLLEYYNLERQGVLGIGDHYLFTLPLSICLFLYFLSLNQNENKVSIYGRKYSMLIFIYHAFPLSVLDFGCKAFNIVPHGIQIIISYIFVWTGTLLLIVGHTFLVNKRNYV